VPDERFHDLVAMSLKELKHSLLVANCSSCTLFLLNPELQKNFAKIEKSQQNNPGLNIQKFAMEGGKWIDGVVADIERDVESPAFKKPEDIKTGYKR